MIARGWDRLKPPRSEPESRVHSGPAPLGAHLGQSPRGSRLDLLWLLIGKSRRKRLDTLSMPGPLFIEVIIARRATTAS